MSKCAIILLVCLTAGTAYAAKWSPYVGLSGQAAIVNTFTGFSFNPSSCVGYQTFPGFGWQVEAGLHSSSFDLYLGYYDIKPYTLIDTDAWYQTSPSLFESTVSENAWWENRGLLGGRWRPAAASASRVQPVVGFALAPGRARLTRAKRQTFQYYSYPRVTEQVYHETDWTAVNLGLLAEFGFDIRVNNSLMLNVVTQIMRSESHFRFADSKLDEDFSVLIPGLRVGANYRLGNLLER